MLLTFIKVLNAFKAKAMAFVVFVIMVNGLIGQNIKDVKIVGVFSGNETNNIIYKAESASIPSLKFIRAQVVGGPQKGFFVQQDDNIRFVSESKAVGIPANLTKIRFTFLQNDKRTPIQGDDFRVIINDIDGPNNEMLQTSCNNNVSFVGTSFSTNLEVNNASTNLGARGSKNEKEGATSRVMFVYNKVTFIEFDSYGNYGYFKDFDLNQDYPMANPKKVKCSNPVAEKLNDDIKLNIPSNDFDFVRNMLVVQTNPIYFDHDEAAITKDAKVELMKVVNVLKKYPALKIELGSHTDSRADKKYNEVLSEKRALSSLNFIAEHGVDINRISAEGFGESRLVNNCTDNVKCSEDEHQLNRRTEFVIVNPEVVLNNLEVVKSVVTTIGDKK